MTESPQRQMELALPMLPDIEIAASRAASNLAREIGMRADDIDEMAHAVIEACINAREHSCCADRRIYLRFVGSTTPEQVRLEMWITDHGRGFDTAEVAARPRMIPSLPRKRGWGLTIMHAHMDEVEIVSGAEGTTVRMVKVGERRNDD